MKPFAGVTNVRLWAIFALLWHLPANGEMQQSDTQKDMLSGRYDFEMGLAYFSVPMDASSDISADEVFEVSRHYLTRRATTAYEDEDMHEKWKSLYLLGELLARSKKVNLSLHFMI